MSKKKYVKKPKNKGFTFIELLATITILGLLVMIPAVSYSKFLAKAHLKYYKSQEDLATLAGKQYFTDYRSELPKEVGSKTSVTLETLYAKKYLDRIKDYKSNVCKASENNENNRVYAYKTGKGNYNYYTIIECNDYITNKDTKGPVIVFTPKTAISNQNITVVAKITDNKKVDVYSYQIIKNNTVIKEETNKLYTSPISFTLTEEGTYHIKVEATDEWGNKTIKTSEKYIIDKTPPDCSKIRFDSDITPKVWQNKTVKVKVIPHSDIAKWNFKNCFYQANSNSEVCKDDGKGFTGNVIKTLAGAKSKVFANTSYKDNGHVFGKITAYDKAGNSCSVNTSEYYVDKDAPVIKSKSITSRNSSYNSKDVVIKLTLTDRVDTTNNKIYYSFSNDNKSYSSWYSYTIGSSNVSTNWTLSDSYDGKSKKVYIKVKDDLGNTKTETLNYTVYNECNNTYSSTVTGSCSTNTGFGTATETKKFYDKFTNNYCSSSTSSVKCCINPAIYYGSWSSCSASCGGGVMTRSITTYNCDGTTSYSSESASCNTQSCQTARCTNVYYQDGSTCSNSCGSGTYNRLAYDYNDDSRCYSDDLSSGGSSCYSSSGCSTPTPPPTTSGFTCNSVGSTQSYAGKSWTVVSNSGGQCKLALNEVSSKSGNYNNAYTNLVNEYFSSGTLLTDKNSGKITSISTDSSGASDISGIYWKGSGTIYDSTTRYSYSCKDTPLFYGGHLSKGDSDSYYIIGCFTAPNINVASSSGTHSVSNSNSTYKITNGNYNETEAKTPGNYKYTSLYLTEYNPKSANSNTKKVNYEIKYFTSNKLDSNSNPVLSSYGSKDSISSKDLSIYACGGIKTHGYNWHQLKYKSKTQFTDIHTTSDVKDNPYDRPLDSVTYRAAAYLSSSGSPSKVRHDNSSTCVYGASSYSISDSSTDIHYRLTITVKTN